MKSFPDCEYSFIFVSACDYSFSFLMLKMSYSLVLPAFCLNFWFPIQKTFIPVT